MFAIRLIFPLLSHMQLQYIYLVCMSAIVTTDTHKADIHEITLLWSGAIPIKVEERRRKILLYEIHLLHPPHTIWSAIFSMDLAVNFPLSSPQYP